MARMQQFLPKMERANEELAEKVAREGKESVVVERVREGEAHVEMVRAPPAALGSAPPSPSPR